jgi:hypothetical protein
MYATPVPTTWWRRLPSPDVVDDDDERPILGQIPTEDDRAKGVGSAGRRTSTARDRREPLPKP